MKAILVIDMPTNCIDCPMCQEDIGVVGIIALQR